MRLMFHMYRTTNTPDFCAKHGANRRHLTSVYHLVDAGRPDAW